MSSYVDGFENPNGLKSLRIESRSELKLVKFSTFNWCRLYSTRIFYSHAKLPHICRGEQMLP